MVYILITLHTEARFVPDSPLPKLPLWGECILVSNIKFILFYFTIVLLKLIYCTSSLYFWKSLNLRIIIGVVIFYAGFYSEAGIIHEAIGGTTSQCGEVNKQCGIWYQTGCTLYTGPGIFQEQRFWGRTENLNISFSCPMFSILKIWASYLETSILLKPKVYYIIFPLLT